MATMYGQDATQLSEVSLAGTQAVAPVQQTFVDTDGALRTMVEGVGNIFSATVSNIQKNANKDAASVAVSDYVKRQIAIDDAVDSGQISVSEGASRGRANFQQAAAANPQYLKELKQAGESLKGFGRLGETERQVQEATDQRKKNIQDATQKGYVFPPNAPKEVVDAQIASWQASVRADETVRRQIQQSQEARAQAAEGRAVSAEQRTIEDRTRKDMSLQLVNELAGTNMNSFSIMGKNLVDQVVANKIPLEQAQQLITQQYSHIQAGIQSAAGLNPELANGYRNTFDEMYKLFNKQLDPKTRVENIENQFTAIIATNKLAAVSDPKLAASVAASQLFGNNPTIAMQLAPNTINVVAQIQDRMPGTPGYTPQVVGVPDVEPQTLNLLKSAVGKLTSPNIPKKDLMATQVNNSANVILKQTGDLIDRGVDPASLKDLASFFASSEYGTLATSGKMDPQAAQAAKKVFQLSYEPAVIKGVQEKLGNYLYSNSASFTGAMQEPKALASNIDVTFSGSGIQFVPKAGTQLTEAEQADRRNQIASLNSSAKAINQLIHIGAHMEGSVNYQKYWEDNKHIYMPQLYSRYQGLEIGSIKNGYRYMGGDANSQKNWVKVNGDGE